MVDAIGSLLDQAEEDLLGNIFEDVGGFPVDGEPFGEEAAGEESGLGSAEFVEAPWPEAWKTLHDNVDRHTRLVWYNRLSQLAFPAVAVMRREQGVMLALPLRATEGRELDGSPGDPLPARVWTTVSSPAIKRGPVIPLGVLLVDCGFGVVSELVTVREAGDDAIDSGGWEDSESRRSGPAVGRFSNSQLSGCRMPS